MWHAHHSILDQSSRIQGTPLHARSSPPARSGPDWSACGDKIVRSHVTLITFMTAMPEQISSSLKLDCCCRMLSWALQILAMQETMSGS